MRARLEMWTKEQGGRHTPIDLAAWESVSVALVLGVFEEQAQVGTATILPK